MLVPEGGEPMENRRQIRVLSIVGGAVGLFCCAAAAVAAVLFAQASRPQDAIIGQWRSEEAAVVIEFYPDGTVETRPDGGESTRSIYAFEDDDTLRLENEGVSFFFGVEISGDTLILTDEGGETLEFARVR
jgi:hypothetical protein